jgi:hypothetical protein
MVISKGESECIIFLDRNKPFGKSFRVQYTHLDIQSLILKLQEVEAASLRQAAQIRPHDHEEQRSPAHRTRL